MNPASPIRDCHREVFVEWDAHARLARQLLLARTDATRINGKVAERPDETNIE